MRLGTGAHGAFFPLLFVIAGCTGIGDTVKQPEFQLDRAVVRGIGLKGGNLDLLVRVGNPNNFTLHGTKLQLGIDVEGSHLGDISYDDDYTVPRNGETMLILPLRFGWLGVGRAVRAALGYGDLPYTMNGQVTLRLPGGFTKAFSFTNEGRAPLTRPGGSVLSPGS
jgi:LEA14-like dessication related protein